MRQSPRWRPRWWRHLSMSDNIWSSRGENLWPEIFHFSHDPYYRPPRPRQAAKQPNATVKTKICPIHYFRSIYATIKKYVPNDLVKLTVTSVVFGFHIIAIVFVCWLRQFWHFHAVATEQFNFNCCQNTKFVPSTILLEFILQERMIH